MTDLLTRAAPDGVSGVEGRRLDIRLYAWGDVATRTEEGIKEQLMPGVFGNVDATRVTLESVRHGGAIVGVGEQIVEREDGIHGTFRVAETPAGDELLALVSGEPPVLRDASVVFAPQTQRISNGIVQRTAGDLRRVAIVERGAYASAQVLAVRSDEVETEDQTTADEVVETVERAEPDPRIAELESRVDKLASIATIPGAAVTADPLAAYDNLADYTAAVYRGEADQNLLSRAAAEQVTGNNPGVLPPSWLTDVKRIVDLGRRAITAFGGPRSIGSTGMTLDWPYLNSSNTLVGVQSSEFDESTTARVDIAKGSEAILTYSGYSDISYQLLQRSEPSYREAYNRILLAAWGSVTDAAFTTALEADATGAVVADNMMGAAKSLSTSAHADDIFDCTGHGFSVGDAVVFTSLTGGDASTAAIVGKIVYVISTSFAANTFRISETLGGSAFTWGTADLSAGTVRPLNTTALGLRQALASASVAVENATGSPASIALASTDMFLAMAGFTDIVPAAGGPSNATGTMDASTLRVEASGMTIKRAPNVGVGKIIVSNPLAAGWHEDGPRFVTAEDVAQLGQYVGVYSFNAAATYVPAGVVELTLV